MNDIEKARAKRDGEPGWECCLPFDVDDEDPMFGRGFVLGVEWETVHQALKSGAQFTRPVHTANVARLRLLCERLNISAEFEPHTGYDGCETWHEMIWGGRK